jgi:LytR cell envelope-related transcriptional attenuator
LPDQLQEIGAVAGLAAIVGLAVLSALYFSQARDVKRLREWAGRAPERSETGTTAVPGRAPTAPQAAAQPGAAQPGAAPPAAGAQPRPGGPPAVPGRPVPTPAAAAATGAGPATAQQSRPGVAVPATAAASAAAAAGGAAAGTKAETPAGTKAETPAGTPDQSGAAGQPGTKPDGGEPKPGGVDAKPDGAEAKPGGADAKAPAAPPAGSAAASGPPSVAPQPVRRTPVPPRPVNRPAASRGVPQETAIIPPRRSQPWYSRLGARYVALLLVGLVVVGGGAAYGISQLTGDDGGTEGTSNAQANNGDGGAGKAKHKGAAVKPANVTVAVLNGTTVPGLAATLSDQVAAAGFKVGTITNFYDQQLAESVVQYAPGHQAEAKAVSRRVGIGQREPVNPSSRALAGDATVIVIAGNDKAP